MRDELERLHKERQAINERISALQSDQSATKGERPTGGCFNALAENPESTLRELFTYHPPESELQLAQYQTIRDAGLHLAIAVAKNSPPGRDQSKAIGLIREAVMLANSAIANKGRSF